MLEDYTHLHLHTHTLPSLSLLSVGLRHILEYVLTKDFTPSFKPVFTTSGGNIASIPVASLQQWLTAHCGAGVSRQPRPIRLKRPAATVGTPTSGGNEATGSRDIALVPPAAKHLKVHSM